MLAQLSEESLAKVMARLEAAEAEAKLLKAELAEKQRPATEGKSVDELARMKPAPLASGLRVDGSTGRLGSGKAGGGGAWLKESDIDFFTRADSPLAASETAKVQQGVAPEDQATLTRRLALGAVGSAAFLALALLPSGESVPPKPLFFYLLPLLRVQRALGGAEALAAEAEWDRLAAVRATMLGEPNQLRASLAAAAAALPDVRAQAAAKEAAALVVEYVDQADYKSYFDSLSTSRPTGQVKTPQPAPATRAGGVRPPRPALTQTRLAAAKRRVRGVQPARDQGGGAAAGALPGAHAAGGPGRRAQPAGREPQFLIILIIVPWGFAMLA